MTKHPKITDPKAHLQQLCDQLIASANEHGYVVTIETKPTESMPLQMGRYQMHSSIRERLPRHINEASV